MNVFEKIREKLEDAQSWEDVDGKPRFTFRDKFMLDVAIQIVKNLEQEHNNGWIPCSEELPEEHECVIVSCLCDEEELIRMACYDNKIGWQVYENDYLGEVIAWQPLPKPFVEE